MRSSVADPNRYDADPDSSFHNDADPVPDPAPHQSDANARLLVYRPSTAPFWASTPPLLVFTTLHSSIFLNFHGSWILTLIRIRIRLSTLTRILLLATKMIRIHAYLDPQHLCEVTYEKRFLLFGYEHSRISSFWRNYSCIFLPSFHPIPIKFPNM